MNCIKVLLFALFWLMATASIKAQLYEQYSSVNQVKYIHNKATAGLAGELELDLIYRTQWQGIEGNPQQVFAAISSPVYPLNGGMGLHFTSDAIGARNITGAGISYNYVLDSDIGLFSFGVGIGYKSARLDQNVLTTPDGVLINGQQQINDPIIGAGDLTSSFMNLTFGLYYANGPF